MFLNMEIINDQCQFFLCQIQNVIFSNLIFLHGTFHQWGTPKWMIYNLPSGYLT